MSKSGGVKPESTGTAIHINTTETHDEWKQLPSSIVFRFSIVNVNLSSNASSEWVCISLFTTSAKAGLEASLESSCSVSICFWGSPSFPMVSLGCLVVDC